jgi:hypothetical protein
MKILINKKFILFIAVLFPFIYLSSSCHNNKGEGDNKDKKILTERIQYDVLIKSPEPDLEWWNQNIEGSKREPFVKTILDLAYSGKVKAYDYFNNPLTPDDVKKIGNSIDTLSLVDPTDPNKVHDTVVKQTLDIQQITKVRFLEEWYLDEKSFVFEKKVVGVMLMRENFDDSLKLRGYSPICWIYFDDKYPAKLK